MLALRELQQEFWNAVTQTSGDHRPAPALLDCLPASATQSPTQRLQVYVDAYFWRLHDVLRESYPQTAASMDEAAFTQLARDYFAAHPSQQPSIAYVGRHFANFLAERNDVAPWCADLARLEWARAEVFEAPDATPIGLDQLRRLPPEAWTTVRFEAIPALRVLGSVWPLAQLWNDARAANVRPARTMVRVWRREWRVLHSVMEPREAMALEQLAAGASFPTLCEAFADLDEAAGAAAAMSLLLRWVEDGLIASASS